MPGAGAAIPARFGRKGRLATAARTTKPSEHVEDQEIADAGQQTRDDLDARRRERRRVGQLGKRNQRIGLSDEDKQAVAGFRRSERREYRKLSPSERKKFRKVYDYLLCEKAPGLETPSSKEAREGLRSALKFGVLKAKDRNGKTVLDHFADRAAGDLKSGLDGPKYGLDARGQLQNLAKAIGHPPGIFQGTRTDTCVATSLQVQLARRDPGEYMRIAGGLVFDGKVDLHGPDGGKSTMKLDKRALWDEQGKKVRDTTQELVQQSFMTYARDKFPPLRDRGDSDGHGAGRAGGRWAFGGNGKGLTMRQSEGLFENVTGHYASALNVTDGNREAVGDAVLAAEKKGRRFQVGLASSRGGHMVTLLGVAEDRNGHKVVRFSDSQTGTQRTMRWSAFKNAMNGVILPTESASRFAGEKTGGNGTNVGGAIPTDSSSLARPTGSRPAPGGAAAPETATAPGPGSGRGRPGQRGPGVGG
jgi:hypothetical protein